jgi:hypothetical protein
LTNLQKARKKVVKLECEERDLELVLKNERELYLLKFRADQLKQRIKLVKRELNNLTKDGR